MRAGALKVRSGDGVALFPSGPVLRTSQSASSVLVESSPFSMANRVSDLHALGILGRCQSRSAYTPRRGCRCLFRPPPALSARLMRYVVLRGFRAFRIIPRTVAALVRSDDGILPGVFSKAFTAASFVVNATVPSSTAKYSFCLLPAASCTLMQTCCTPSGRFARLR